MIEFKSYSDIFLDFIFPKFCYICGSTGKYICDDCKKLIYINLMQRCHVCGKEARSGFVHTDCRPASYLAGLLYVTLYDGKIKTIVRDVKYHYYFAVFTEVAEMMSKYLNLYHFENLIITSVPLHWKKKNSRGFNQSELLAKKIAKFAGVKYIELLERSENTKAQASLGREERASNLKTAFQMMGKYNLRDKNIMIVDDVFTTGATLNECAKVLENFGASNIYGFCFAKSQE